MKTACVYHAIDLDGWMSAAIVKLAHEKIVKERSELRQEDMSIVHSIDFIGYNYGQPIPDLSEYDKVIMVDISFPEDVMNNLIGYLGTEENKNFIWIDHHISAISNPKINENWAAGLRNTSEAACELTWQYFFPNKTMPEIVRLLGRYDCFGHKGTDEELKVLEFQYGARSVITNVDSAYIFLRSSITFPYADVEKIHNAGIAIYDYLRVEAKQAYANGFELRIYDDKLNQAIARRKGALDRFPYYRFICINKERFNPINFGIDYHAEGYDGTACFHKRADGKWLFSLYNDNGEVDCSVIAKQYGGGGHKGAAGFVVASIEEFFENAKF